MAARAVLVVLESPKPIDRASEGQINVHLHCVVDVSQQMNIDFTSARAALGLGDSKTTSPGRAATAVATVATTVATLKNRTVATTVTIAVITTPSSHL